MNPDTVQQLTELKKVIARSAIGFVILAVICALGAGPLFQVFAEPLLQLLDGQSMIATQVSSPFLIPLKFSLAFALILSLPWFAYQLWRYIAPALFTHERRYFTLALCLCLSLFYVGILFSYSIVMPMALKFFVNAAPVGVQVMTDIDDYLSFALKLLLAFGFVFQVPILVVGLVRSGFVKKSTLQAQRPYIIIGAFTLGMLLTPPDVLSQTMLALPLWLLYELGLWCCK